MKFFIQIISILWLKFIYFSRAVCLVLFVSVMFFIFICWSLTSNGIWMITQIHKWFLCFINPLAQVSFSLSWDKFYVRSFRKVAVWLFFIFIIFINFSRFINQLITKLFFKSILVEPNFYYHNLFQRTILFFNFLNLLRVHTFMSKIWHFTN